MSDMIETLKGMLGDNPEDKINSVMNALNSGIHGVCGSLGTILTGLFATEEGLLYGGGFGFLGAQIFGVIIVGLWATFMGFVIFKGLDMLFGLRVNKRIEEEGLDIYEHGESAYNS